MSRIARFGQLFHPLLKCRKRSRVRVCLLWLLINSGWFRIEYIFQSRKIIKRNILIF